MLDDGSVALPDIDNDNVAEQQEHTSILAIARSCGDLCYWTGAHKARV